MLFLPFKTGTRCYLYSGWSNRIMEVTGNLFSFYSLSGNDDEQRAAALRSGLIPQENPAIEVMAPRLVEESISALKKNGPDMLVLSISEECNFRCTYCYYSETYSDSRSHSQKHISSVTAFAAVDWYFRFERTEYRIGFYGGEPLLDFSLIKEIVSHAESILPDGSRLVFALTTNGSLLNDEICDFLAEKQFETFVSLDGPENIHDRHRRDKNGKPTFNKIWNNLKRFRQRHPAYVDALVNFCMTISPPDSLADISNFMECNPDVFGNKIPKLSSVKPVFGDNNTPPNHSLMIQTTDYSRFWDSFIDSSVRGSIPPPLERALCEPSTARVHKRFMTEINSFVTTGGQCTPGKRCFVDTDGVYHMCERANSFFPIGSVRDGYDFDSIAAYLKRYAGLMKSRCSDCWAVRLCRKCIPLLAEGDNLPETKLDAFCEGQKRDLVASLTNYCRAREKKNDCFDWITDIVNPGA